MTCTMIDIIKNRPCDSDEERIYHKVKTAHGWNVVLLAIERPLLLKELPRSS